MTLHPLFTADRSGAAPAPGAPHCGDEDGDLFDPDVRQAAVVTASHGRAHAGSQPSSGQRHRHQTLGTRQTTRRKHIQSAFNHLWKVCFTLISEQGFVEVVSWLDEVTPLLYSTPLLSVLSRTHLLVNNIAIATKPWNTQQVCSCNIHCNNVLRVHSNPNNNKKKEAFPPQNDIAVRLLVQNLKL